MSHFLLFANCIPVQGASRSIIVDLHRKSYDFIPNALFEILTKYPEKNLVEIKQIYEGKYDKIIDEYFEFLHQKEYIYWCDKEFRDRFPSLNLEWDYPGEISNAIFDCNMIPSYITKEVVDELDALGCRHIEIRIFKQVDLACLFNNVISLFDRSGISTINIYLPYYEIGIDALEKLLIKYPRVKEINLSGSGKTSISIVDNAILSRIIFLSETITSERHCGVVLEEYMTPLMHHFTESLKFNTCLNRKISIDPYGEIRNCPSMKESFGNIENTSLEEALKKPGFKKYWNITKNHVSKCKDCEFRHICTDCRAYLDDPKDIYSAPLKCGYNPYTCEWEEWSTNPLKQTAIESYGMREIT